MVTFSEKNEVGPGETTKEGGTRKLARRESFSTSKNVLANLVMDLSRRSSKHGENDDPFALDYRVNDDYGTGNAKIFSMNQSGIPSTFSRLAKNDQSLTELTFRFIKLNKNEISLLSLALEKNIYLRKLSFYKTEINDDNAQELAKGIKKNYGLEEITFYQNQFTEKGSCLLCEAIDKNQTITSFVCFKNKLGINALKFLKDNRNITSINLFNNGIEHEGAKIIAHMIQLNPNLTSISIGNNHIGNLGMCTIAEKLKEQKNLTKLVLTGNRIGKEGALSISEALQNCETIEELDLSGNMMGDDGCITVVKKILSKICCPVRDINLSHNNISNGGAQYIMKLLDKNTSLQKLKLRGSQSKYKDDDVRIIQLMRRNLVISNHRIGVENFGPFYYVTVGETSNGGDNNTANKQLVLGWTRHAWQAAETSGHTIAVLHKIILELTLFANHISATEGFVNIGGERVSHLTEDDLRSKFVASKQLATTNEMSSSGSLDIESFRAKCLKQDDDTKYTLEFESTDSCEDTNSVLKKLCKIQNIKDLLTNCKDHNGNTILSIVKKSKGEESFNFIRFIMRTFFLGDDELESDQQTSCEAMTAKSVDDTIDFWEGNSKLILGRYKVENYPDKPMHKSDKSSVYSAVDVQVDSWNNYRRVALKFLDEKEAFEKELFHRLESRNDIASGQDLIYKDKQNDKTQNMNKFDDNYVMPIIRFHDEERCLVMPLGDRNLDQIIRNEASATNDLNSIRILMKSIVMSLKYLHQEHGMIHGDIKPRNFVRHNGKLKMLDLHEVTYFNEVFEARRSTGYIAPELAKEIFIFEDSKGPSYWAKKEKKIMKKLLKLDGSDAKNEEVVQLREKLFEEVRPNIRRSSLSSAMSSTSAEEMKVASPVLDIWSFGVLSFYLLTGTHLFDCDQYDNIYASDLTEQEKLLLWNGMTESDTGRICLYSEDSMQQTNVINLLQSCLHPDRRLRFLQMDQVLNHAFFRIDESISSPERNPPLRVVETGTSALRNEANASPPVESIAYRSMSSSIHDSTCISILSQPKTKREEIIDRNHTENSRWSEDLTSVAELKITHQESVAHKWKKKICCG